LPERNLARLWRSLDEVPLHNGSKAEAIYQIIKKV
jgi:hypothetical protein